MALITKKINNNSTLLTVFILCLIVAIIDRAMLFLNLDLPTLLKILKFGLPILLLFLHATRALTFGDKTIAAEDVHLSTLATLDRYYGKVADTESFIKGQ